MRCVYKNWFSNSILVGGRALERSFVSSQGEQTPQERGHSSRTLGKPWSTSQYPCDSQNSHSLLKSSQSKMLLRIEFSYKIKFFTRKHEHLATFHDNMPIAKLHAISNPTRRVRLRLQAVCISINLQREAICR